MTSFPEPTAVLAEATMSPQRRSSGAAASPSPPSRRVLTQALLQLEAAARHSAPLSPSALLGLWQLRFTIPQKANLQAGQPTATGFYIPSWVQASIGFWQPEAQPTLSIQNQLILGPLQVGFSGSARWLGKKNLLIFQFDCLNIQGGPLRLYQGKLTSPTTVTDSGAAAKLPFFSFFTATSNYMAARGRGGGVALWRKIADP